MTEKNEAVVTLLGALDKKKTKRQVDSQLKQLEKTIRTLQLTGTFAHGDMKKEVNAYLKQLQAQLEHVKLTARIDSQNIKGEIDHALHSLSFRDIDALNIDRDKMKLKLQKAMADVKAYASKNPVSVGIHFEGRRNRLENDLAAYLDQNTKIQESDALQKGADTLRTLIGTAHDEKSLREAADALKLYKSSVASAGYHTESTADKIKSLFSHVKKIGDAFGLASLAADHFMQALQTLRANDTVLTQIGKTADLTQKQLQALLGEAFQTAGKYGQSSTDFLLTAQEMARAGYDRQLRELAALGAKLQSAGGMTAELANRYMIAADTAFRLNGSVEALEAALDGANAIASRHALSMTELGEAMGAVGLQAADAGMGIRETTAAVAALLASTRMSGSETANAFAGILLYLQQLTGEAGGTEIDAQSLAAYEKACRALGVSLSTVRDGMVSLKEPMEILRELSAAYVRLDKSDPRRLGLLDAVGGESRADALHALLTNYDLYETLLQQYADGLGSLDRQAAKTANTWEGRMNALSNSFTSFVHTLTDKDAILGGISVFDRLIQGAEALVDTFGALPVTLSAVQALLAAKRKDYGITQLWDSESGKPDLQGRLFGIDITGIKNAKKHFADASIAISNWNHNLANGKTDLDSFDNKVVQNNLQLKEYLSLCSQDAPASLKGYRQYLKAAGQSTDALRLKTVLLSTAMTLLGGITLQAVIMGIAQAFDQFNVTVAQSREKTENIRSKITDLSAELAKLKDEQNKTPYDHSRIQQLETEIRLQKQLLEIEQKRLYQNQIGTTFSDYFDKDSLVTKKRVEQDRYNKNGYAYLSVQSEKATQDLEYVNEDISFLQQKLADSAISDHDRSMIEAEINMLLREREEILDRQTHIAEQLLTNSAAYLQNYRDAKEATESGLLTGDDLTQAEEMAAYWKQMYDDAMAIAVSMQKQNGTYDYSTMIRDILAKADFKDISQQLETLAKSGGLSVETLCARFPTLIEYLEGAGISARELYKYLVALTDPDAINVAETNRQLRESIGIRGGIINGASDQKKWEEVKSAFDQKDWELVLKAYLKIRDQYGEHPKGWTAKDWIANMQSELEPEKLAVGVSFEQAWADSFTAEDAAVRELGNTLLDLAKKGRLTGETFAAADTGGYFQALGISADEAAAKINHLADTSKQLSSMAGQLSSMADALGTKREDGFVSADTLAGFDPEIRSLDAWDRFQETLGSTASSYEECREAANALATEWVNGSNFLAQLTEQNKEYYASQLEAMGVDNYEEVVSHALALHEAKEILTRSGLLLGEATREEIEALTAEGTCSELTASMILALYDAKAAQQAAQINTASDCENLIALAGDTDRTSKSVALLTRLMAVYNDLENGVYDNNGTLREKALTEVETIKKQLEELEADTANETKIKIPVNINGDRIQKAAQAAGQSAADSYLEAFEEEYSHLKDMLDFGTISEAEYLNSLRTLYTGYFRDRREYLDTFQKYEREYLTGMLDLHNKALGGISTLLNRRIASANDARDATLDALHEEKDARLDALEDEKDAAIKAIEAERQARLAGLETQRKQYESQIKLIEKQVKEKEKAVEGIREEIQAMQDANADRKRQIDLQKAQYTLQRMQNQRTTLQYSEQEGMHYVNNPQDIQNAREEADEAKLAVAIAQKEKQIGLIEKEINLLQEQKDTIHEQMDLLNEQIDKIQEKYDRLIDDTTVHYDALIQDAQTYYEGLVKQQEQYWDSVIKGMEQTKSRYEQLAEVEEIAQAFSYIQQVFGDIGYSVEDVLNGSDAAFEAFREKYIATMAAVTQNTSFRDGLAYAVSDSILCAGQKLGQMKQLGNDAADGLLLGIAEKKQAFQDSLRSLAEDGQLAFSQGFSFQEGPLKTSFDALILLIRSVSDALGFGPEASVTGLLGALKQLSDFSLGDGDGEGILSQFDNLKTAVDGVVCAIAGGDTSGKNAPGPSGADKGPETAAGTGGLVGSISSIQSVTDEALGSSAKSEDGKTPEGEGTGAIGRFEQFKTAVDDVTAAIGSSDTQSSQNFAEDADTLTGSIRELGSTSGEILGEPDGEGVIAKFNEFKNVIAEAASHVTGISEGLEAIDGQDVECTVTVNMKMNGGIHEFASGTVLGGMKLESATYAARYGKAFASGAIGLKKDEQNALRSEYGQPELTVYPDGTTELTTSPVMGDLPKGTVIYNEEQTKKILGQNPHPAPNDSSSSGTVILKDGTIPRPVPPDDRAWDTMKKWNAYVERTNTAMDSIGNTGLLLYRRQMDSYVKHVNTFSNITNTKNVQPVINGGINISCPGITSQEVARQVKVQLNNMFNGLHNYADQMSRIR